MAKLYNLARMTTATTGTGTITLGSAVASYVTFANAGVQNSDTVTYAIVDGNNREVGRGVYTSSGTTLTRATILESTNGNLAINLSGNAEVFITAAAEDITSNVEITGGSITGITDLAIADGGTGQSTASAAANALDGYLTIASAAGTTTLTNTSARTITVTGSTTQTIVLPVVSTLALGWSFTITNLSTGAVTIQSSGANAFANTLTANLTARLVCIAVTGTTTASWTMAFAGSTGRSGTGSLVLATSPTITTPLIASLSGGSAVSSTLTLQSTTGAGTTDAIIFNTGSQSERMRITTAGSVGIGTATTSSRLEVLGGVANSITALGTEDVATVTITNSDVSGIGRLTKTLYQVGNLSLAAVGAVYSAFNAGGDIGGDLVFGTQTNLAGGVVERLRISKDGAFGIAGSNYGSSGQFIKSAGSAAAPSWASIANTDVSGLGTMSTQNANNVSISGGSITGITDLAIADGGTGASNAATARTNLGAAASGANTDITSLNLGAGTVSAPSLSTTGDTNTGMFFPAADTIAFTNGGVEEFRIGPAGQFGIAGANYGTSGQVLTSGGSGASPSWANAGGLTLISALAASGTNPIASGLTLTGYKMLCIVTEGVTQNSGANRGFLIGTSTADDLSFSGNAVFNAVTARGIMWIDLNAGTMTSIIEPVAAGATAPASNSASIYIADLPFTTASTAISFALSGSGSFNAGTFRIYGLA